MNRILKWLYGDTWICACTRRHIVGRPAQIKFVVNLGSKRFARYVNATESDPVITIVDEIRGAAPDQGLDLSPRSLRKLHKVVEKAHHDYDDACVLLHEIFQKRTD